jgi:hypothetical protein
MAALCRDRAGEFAAMPVAVAAALVKDSLETVMFILLTVLCIRSSGCAGYAAALAVEFVAAEGGDQGITSVFARCGHNGSFAGTA